MSKKGQGFNPFYALLVVTATCFTLTACLYVVTDVSAASGASGLRALIHRHGTLLLLAQGALIVVLSLAAMALDSWRWKGTRRTRRGGSR